MNDPEYTLVKKLAIHGPVTKNALGRFAVALTLYLVDGKEAPFTVTAMKKKDVIPSAYRYSELADAGRFGVKLDLFDGSVNSTLTA